MTALGGISVDINGCLIPINTKTGEPELLQTWWHQDAWRVCVTSLLLVATRRDRVEPMLQEFYERWPGEVELLAASPTEMVDFLHPLGLPIQRAERLKEFTADYVHGFPVRDCYGVGPYVEAAYRLVHLKDAYCETDDTVLTLYRAWLRSLPEDPLRWVT